MEINLARSAGAAAALDTRSSVYQRRITDILAPPPVLLAMVYHVEVGTAKGGGRRSPATLWEPGASPERL